MGDAVKVTVIATGFQPEHLPVVPERRGSVVPVIRVQPEPRMRLPEPEPEPEPIFIPEPAPMPEPEPEPAMMAAESEPLMDLDDLDTPAYLRQGRLLN
jgi:hypothetical protein